MDPDGSETRVREKTCHDYEGMLRRYIRPNLSETVNPVITWSLFPTSGLPTNRQETLIWQPSVYGPDGSDLRPIKEAQHLVLKSPMISFEHQSMPPIRKQDVCLVMRPKLRVEGQ
jgi:hypothetical protein